LVLSSLSLLFLQPPWISITYPHSQRSPHPYPSPNPSTRLRLILKILPPNPLVLYTPPPIQSPIAFLISCPPQRIQTSPKFFILKFILFPCNLWNFHLSLPYRLPQLSVIPSSFETWLSLLLFFPFSGVHFFSPFDLFFSSIWSHC